LGVLLTGLWLFGTGEALLVASHLGNTPWTVLAQGVSKHSPLSIGAATFAISLVVLIAWIPLRERPGFGTIANAVVIAVAIDVMLDLLPHPRSNVARLGEVLAAIVSANATVPSPTRPPSSQPMTSTVSSSDRRTVAIGMPVRRAIPVIHPSRGPGPSHVVR
jgi:hypothetical protein